MVVVGATIVTQIEGKRGTTNLEDVVEVGIEVVVGVKIITWTEDVALMVIVKVIEAMIESMRVIHPENAVVVIGGVVVVCFLSNRQATF